MRETMSTPNPPGPKGTTIVTVLVGQVSCAAQKKIKGACRQKKKKNTLRCRNQGVTE